MMIPPLVDTHCHLLPGLDDGPGSLDESLDMCRLAWQEGTRVVAATAHMSDHWPENTAERIRRAAQRLARVLQETGPPLTVYPSAEVRIQPDVEQLWREGLLLGMGGRPAYVLLEFPPQVCFDIRGLVQGLLEQGVRPILAHPERHPELLHGTGRIEELTQQGCLVQITASSLSEPASRRDFRALKRWVQEGIVHLVGSDGHSPLDRPPLMAQAYRQIAQWAGSDAADRLCSLHGLMVLEGSAVRARRPAPRRRGLSRLSPW